MRHHQITKHIIKKYPPPAFVTPEIKSLGDIFDTAGHEIRLVGGCVRDYLVGGNPKDIDLATTATPDEQMALYKKYNIKYIAPGIEHGTITAILDGEPIEITTLRIDTETDGRHAEVQFTNDWRKDAERRDLTFNAMSMEMNGTLHDYFDGIQDLKNGVARFVGNADARMQEDFLRILRYFRFQGRLNSPTWDRETMDAVRRNAAGLRKISGERVWMEMEKVLAQPRSRADVLERMNEAGVLDAIDMPTNRINFVNQVDGDDPVAALAAAVNSTTDLDAVRRRWKFSTDAYARARFIIENRDGDLSDGALRRMLADPKIRSEHVFSLLNSIGQGSKIASLKAWTPPVFPVTGADLTAAGMRPGPHLGQTLASLRREWENSGFKLNKEQLLRKIGRAHV